MMSTVLEPSLYTKARLPLEQAESLPRWCYTTQEFYDEEVSRIFRKTWNFVGREDEIPSPGDFLTVDCSANRSSLSATGPEAYTHLPIPVVIAELGYSRVAAAAPRSGAPITVGHMG